MGLYNAELRKTCLTFMPKEIKYEREIKAVLDHQLINLRTWRTPAQDMAELHSTYGNDGSEMSKANEMLKMGQVPMDVNAMPGLVEDMSDVEDLEAEGGVNALQNEDMCYFSKKTGHQKRDCRKFEEWKKKNPHKKPRGNPRSDNSRPSISCYNCGMVIYPRSAEENGEIKIGVEIVDMGADRWRIWLNLWQRCKKF